MAEENIQQIDEEIESLKTKKKELKQIRDKKLRLRSNNCGKSNVLRRVSINFANRLDYINKKRDENGFDCLSGPKITELIAKHRKCWKIVQSDIIRYNTNYDNKDDEVEFNDK